MCGCDVGYICGYHRESMRCDICERRIPKDSNPPLCGPCLATAKAAGKEMARQGRDAPDPEWRRRRVR